jgi:hypothetical protein
MKTINNHSNFILYNISNYKETIDTSISQILDKFIEVILEYMKFIAEKLVTKNRLHCRFIFEKGIEALIHVFTIMFYYTKNIDLTFYHTQKAYYFYIEYIEQITDVNVTFLHLTSQDATLFVYKNTIFHINNEYKKKVQEPKQEEKCIFDMLHSYIHIYKNILLFVINNDPCIYDNQLRRFNIDRINHTCNSIIDIREMIKLKSNALEYMQMLITLFNNNNDKINTETFFHLLKKYIKKSIGKKHVDEKTIYDSIEKEIVSFSFSFFKED